MKETVQPVFLILGAAGSTVMVDHTIVEMPSRNAGDIVGQDSVARLKSGGIADRAYFRVVSPSA